MASAGSMAVSRRGTEPAPREVPDRPFVEREHQPVDQHGQARGPSLGLHSRSEEHTSELQSLMRISYAVFCLKKKRPRTTHHRRQPSYSTHRIPDHYNAHQRHIEWTNT